MNILKKVWNILIAFSDKSKYFLFDIIPTSYSIISGQIMKEIILKWSSCTHIMLYAQHDFVRLSMLIWKAKVSGYTYLPDVVTF